MPQVKQISMLIATLLLGILVSLQWPTMATPSDHTSDRVNRTVQQLELEQQELKRTIGRLRQELDKKQQEAVANTQILRDVRQELTKQKMYAGLLDVRGPGVIITLSDGPRALGGNADQYLIHDYDLRDVVNVLWMADSEAIAINDERIVNSTSIYCVGSTIMINDTRLSPPYEVRAIGNPIRQLDYLRNPGYLSELKTRQERFKIGLEFSRIETISIPAYRGSLRHKYAQPGG